MSETPAYWENLPPPGPPRPQKVLEPAAGKVGTQWTDMDGAGAAGGTGSGGGGSSGTISNVIINFNGTLYFCTLDGTIGDPV